MLGPQPHWGQCRKERRQKAKVPVESSPFAGERGGVSERAKLDEGMVVRLLDSPIDSRGGIPRACGATPFLWKRVNARPLKNIVRGRLVLLLFRLFTQPIQVFDLE